MYNIIPIFKKSLYCSIFFNVPSVLASETPLILPPVSFYLDHHGRR